MAEVSFYHLHNSPVEKVLPVILKKALEKDMRSMILTSGDDLEIVNKWLWTYGQLEFLPHGSKNDNFSEKQPIYLSDELENPNNAKMFVNLTEDTLNYNDEKYNEFSRIVEIFDGNIEEKLKLARKKWSSYKKGGYNLVYWKQSDTGGWEQV